jgi:branched-chain amino acid transport system permease protein
MCFALFACAFNLLIGYVGLLSFGHALISAGELRVRLPGEDGIAFSASAILGLVIPLNVNLPPFTPETGNSRRNRDLQRPWAWHSALSRSAARASIFAMITLALCAARLLLQRPRQKASPAATTACQAVPRAGLFGDQCRSRTIAFIYVVVAAIFVFGFLMIYRIVHSPFGQVLKAIRENEPRAISLGYRVDQYKLRASSSVGGLAGLAGATKAIVFQLASLTDVDWTMSAEVVLNDPGRRARHGVRPRDRRPGDHRPCRTTSPRSARG